MQFAIRHFMPGRVRINAPTLCRRRKLAEATLKWLRSHDAVRRARINYDCASLIVEYDVAHEKLLRLLLGHLRLMDWNDLRRLVTPEQDAGEPQPLTAQDLIASPPLAPNCFPLILPTLSLVMTFSLNPIARAINAPLMLWNAYPIALRAWRIWRRESRLNVDFLDTLAITASVAQNHHTAGALITWLVKLGDWFRDLTMAGSKRAIGDLLEFQSKTAWIKIDGLVVSVPARALKVGDEVVVYPGEVIPVDGEIIDGNASIDQKTITGEGLPVTRGRGEAVFAATVIRDGQLAIKAMRVGSETTAGQIVRLIDSAPIGDTRMQNHAERLADRLVVPTLALASGAAFLSRDFNRFLSLVIVDYGTGIRVSAPTAMLSSMTHAAKAGIIAKSGRHMERLAEVDTIIFDKTGTLTQGAPAIIDLINYQDHMTPGHLLGLAAAAESRLQHPVAEALRARAKELQVNLPVCDETQYQIGLGVEGQVNGYYMHVGNERFMRQSNIWIGQTTTDRANLDEQGYSCLYIAVDGKMAGLVPYADQIRPESPSVIQRLKEMGIRNTIMLTGDNPVVARAVAERLGLTRQYADMLPADKAEVIQKLQREGNIVAMVGDGIDDFAGIEFCGRGHRHETWRGGDARVRRCCFDGRLALEAGQSDRNLAQFRRSYQTELCDRGGHEHNRARTGSSRRVDQPFGHRADQQWLSHCGDSQWHAPSFTFQMKPPAPEATLSPAHLEALRRALILLEQTSFATQLSEYAGRPANYVLRKMPKTINDRLNHIAEIAILKSLDVAIKSIKPASKRPPATKLSSLLAGISGGVGGFLGAAALPVELPLTTIVMLRAIADIARHHGENLSTIEGRLACVEVFALGDRGSNERMNLGYYASRALLSKFTKDASTFLT